MGLPPPRAASLTYLPQLDAFAHSRRCWSYGITGRPARSPLGPIGVWIFFVISGVPHHANPVMARARRQPRNRTALVRFYVRRVLRIFPLYYFVLLLGLIFSPALRATWPWYVAYLQNFKFIWASDPDALFGVHLWTLAVEEQFYVVWPLVMLFLPRFLLLPTIGCAITVAIATRGGVHGDGMAAVRGLRVHAGQSRYAGIGRAACVFRDVPIGAGRLAAARRAGRRHPDHPGDGSIGSRLFRAAVMQLPTGLIALWYIAHATSGVPRVLGRLLALPPSVYLGRISYGIYVYTSSCQTC
jgi:peptidoglycan/LPS O-acetylase OafA/YrhL